MGVNEWLIEGLGVGTMEFKPIVVKCSVPNRKLVVTGFLADAPVLEKMLYDAGATIDSYYAQQPWGVPKDSATSKVRSEAVVTYQQNTEILQVIGPLRATVDLYPLAAEPLASGCGRVSDCHTIVGGCAAADHSSFGACLCLCGTHRGAAVRQTLRSCCSTRLALALLVGLRSTTRKVRTVEESPQIRSVGVCASSGADWLKMCDADLVWRGGAEPSRCVGLCGQWQVCGLVRPQQY